MKKYFYVTDHTLSIEMSEYFRKGFDVEISHVKDIEKIKASGFFYGILRNCYDSMMFLKSNNIDFYYVDYGYIRKINNITYYRICKNSRFLNFYKYDLPNDRYLSLGLNLKYDLNKGTKIVVFEPSPFVCMINGFNQSQWVNNVVNEIKKYTDREIVISRKSFNFNKDLLSDAYVLVHYASMGAIEALIRNIPIITLGNFFLEKIYNNSIKDIENLKYCDNREEILYNLSYNQYTLEEIESGKAREIIKYLGEYND